MAGPRLFFTLLICGISTTWAEETFFTNDIFKVDGGRRNSDDWTAMPFKNKRYLDLTYGYPAYPDCVCGLSSQGPTRAPRFQVVTENDDIRVVGGQEAVPHSLPWMALIFAEPKKTPICGGSIISDRYVVTAAHCLDSSIAQEDLKVVLGEHNHCERDRLTTRFSVDRMLVHPAFRHQDYFADIMLLRLSMRITFSRIVRPICLPSLGANFEGAWSLVAGWGTSNFSGSPECALHQAPLPVLSKEICVQSSQYPPETVHASLLCAGYLGEGGTDSCQGDSGGPLQYLHPQTHRFTLIGIVSNGVGCGLADFPGLYTDVSHFISWILTSTQDSAYCFR